MDHKDGRKFYSGLLPGDAAAWAHAHHMLDLLFGIIGTLGDLYASCLLVPFEDVRTETDTRFAIRAIGSINDRIFLQCLSRSHGFGFSGCVFLVDFTSPFVLPGKILPISEARSEFSRRSLTMLSPAQATPRFAAHLALFAIRALFFFLLLGHFPPPPISGL